MTRKVSFTLLIKLGSIAIHIEELLSPKGHELDKEALKTLLEDKEVRIFLEDPKMKVFFPIKRNSPTIKDL